MIQDTDQNRQINVALEVNDDAVVNITLTGFNNAYEAETYAETLADKLKLILISSSIH